MLSTLRRRGALLLLFAAAVTGCAHRTAPASGFAVVGDMPYGTGEVHRVDALIRQINADAATDLVLHVGDIKGGGERCDDALLRERLQQLGRLRPPVLYTPGDNEWTDCHRPFAGAFNPLERLATLRRLAYADPQRSLGREAVAVHSQAADPAHAAFVENTLLERAGVIFATVHVVGSRNDLLPWTGFDPLDSMAFPRADRLAAFRAREAANLAWIDRAFAEAGQRGARGVVIAMQANPRFEAAAGHPDRTAFGPVLDRLQQRAREFGRPVLIVHGDDHEHFVDRPWPALPQVQRVQGFGSPDLRWVRLRVEPGAPELFRVEPQPVPR